jgi:hypothetical protein
MQLVINPEARPQNVHSGVYNQPTGLKEVQVLMSDSPTEATHSIVIRSRRADGPLQFISDIHHSFDPLHYPLLFPEGEHSWYAGMPSSPTLTAPSKQLSIRDFYAYHLNERDNERQSLFRAERLFQEYCCCAWSRVERQRLLFLKQNQNAIRAEHYNVLQIAISQDHMNAQDAINERNRVGKKMILPATYIGSPRYMNSKYQDAMAIVRTHGKPDLFITMTMNPNHPDVLAALLPGQLSHNRPDIISRIFKGLLDMLIEDIKDNIFGKVVAFLYSIEYQARGIPHAHILIFLAVHDKFNTTDKIDSVVCAEIPQDQLLQDLVLKYMCHSPCGALNPRASCMIDGKCSKHYPKDFSSETIWHNTMDHPTYRRRQKDAQHPWFEKEMPQRHTTHAMTVVNNQWIVPYNPFLLKKYRMHINIEMCNTAMASKYLFKYITKGPDRAMAKLNNNNQQESEIQDYEDLRSIGASEACWRIFTFETNEIHPTVQALPIHLENGQRIAFQEGDQLLAVQGGPPDTQLTMWFHYNLTKDPTEPPQLYPNFPQDHVWNRQCKVWTRRKRTERFPTIGRVHHVHPTMGELYYLRLILHNDHSLGAHQFSSLKTLPNGSVVATYQEVCLHLGLLQDDGE